MDRQVRPLRSVTISNLINLPSSTKINIKTGMGPTTWLVPGNQDKYKIQNMVVARR